MKLPELEELYARYKTDVYRYLCSLTHDLAEAEDLLSETFLRVLRRLPTFRGECSVKTWLFAIARNIWLESLRRRHETRSCDDMLERYVADTLAEDVGSRLLLQRVQALLAQRDDRSRRVVMMRAQGYAYAEIAARLEISEGSARVIEHRTRAWLRETLHKEGYNDV